MHRFWSASSIVVLTALALCASGPVDAAEGGRKPNVIILLADDLGYADTGFQGSQETRTPHLDALAQGGVRCTDGYVTCPVCSPSRAALLTGRYQQRYGY